MSELPLRTATVATFVVLIAIMLFSGFAIKPQFDNPVRIYKEEPLEKNTEFQLRDGERYVYSYYLYGYSGSNRSSGRGTHVNISYEIFYNGKCTEIIVVENVNRSGVCVDRWGLDRKGYNATLENPQVLLFKPWMLALREGWHWNTSMYLVFNSTLEKVGDMNYRVMRTESYRGRTAFVVTERVDNARPRYEWIDAEKRILLRSSGEGYEVVLAQGLALD